MSRHYLIGALILCVCIASLVPVALSASYDMTVSGSIDTPTRTVSIDGDQHEVSAVAEAKPGDTVSVSVSAPTDADYRVNLYNGDRQVVAQRPGTGDEEVRFDLTDYEPGSYMLLLYKDGDHKDAFPVIVSGYDVAMDAPSSATVDSDMTVDVSIAKTTDVEAPDSVEVVFANSTHTQRVTAQKTDSSTYQATVSLQDVSLGDYRVYAVVHGSETAFDDDHKEVLGISDATTVTVQRQQTTEESSESTSGSSSTERTTTTTTTATATTTTETTSPNTSTQTATTTPNQSSTSQTTHSSPTTTTTTAPPSTTDQVLTPATSTASTSTSTSTPGPGVPGFELTGTVLAVLCALYLGIRK